MRSEVADVLKDQNEAEAFLTTFTKHEERLLDAKEDFDKVLSSSSPINEQRLTTPGIS